MADKICLFMKMRKQRLIEKYCRVRGSDQLEVSEKYKICQFQVTKEIF